MKKILVLIVMIAVAGCADKQKIKELEAFKTQYESETLKIKKAVAVARAERIHKEEVAALKAEKKRLKRKKEKEEFNRSMDAYYNHTEEGRRERDRILSGGNIIRRLGPGETYP